MPKVITESSTLKCSSQGAVQLSAGQSKLTVNGAKVLVQGDLEGSSISGCTIVTDPNTGKKQCTAVVAAPAGAATKLKVDGKPVLLETVAGPADGLAPVPETFSVQSAGQTQLEAV